ncbi:hypothetical protein, partial [Bacteroides acidifaciens]|uniref:hypothetical protein n=1 Tax=Bacteroides acidifaciens TaxID=85831 RepID=UPI001C3FC3AB
VLNSIFTLQNAFAAISEYLTIKNKENSQLKCISLKLRVLIYIEGVFELLTHPLLYSNLFGQFSYLFYFCPSPINTLKI